MRCIHCNSRRPTRVLESRQPPDKKNCVRRRRACVKCKGRFTTYERIEDEERKDAVEVALKKLETLKKSLKNIKAGNEG